MRVLVAGATGVIGRRLVPGLLADGHDVWGMTRSRSDIVEGLGARAVECDALDANAMLAAVAQVKPDRIVHQLTSLPQAINPRRADRDMAANDRLRSEGTANLMAAAKVAGVERVVAQSIAFAYHPGPHRLRIEEDPLFDNSPPPFDRTVGALRALESAVLQSEGVDGVVLRYGFWYGPGTAYAADGHWATEVQRRRFPIIGGGGGVWSFTHVDDAAAATHQALSDVPGGVYNIVDDDPSPVAIWLPVYAEAVGGPPPRRVPAWLARLVAGQYAVTLGTELAGGSKQEARDEVGWTPRWSSWREGFKHALG